MNTTVKFKRLLDKMEGVSDNGAWVRQGIVTVQISDGPSAKTMVFNFSSQRMIEEIGKLKDGDIIEVYFQPESREYTKQDGTKAWITDLRAYGMKVWTTPPPATQQ